MGFGSGSARVTSVFIRVERGTLVFVFWLSKVDLFWPWRFVPGYPAADAGRAPLCCSVASVLDEF